MKGSLVGGLILSVFVCACSHGRSGPSLAAYGVSIAGENVEVAATPEEQALEEVLATPTDFDVPIEQERFAWERARLFLESYSGGETGPVNAVVRVVGNRRGLASAPGRSAYSYEVLKEFLGDTYRYSVRCVATADGHPQGATINAANFARFIRDGKLEVSLLEQ